TGHQTQRFRWLRKAHGLRARGEVPEKLRRRSGDFREFRSKLVDDDLSLMMINDEKLSELLILSSGVGGIDGLDMEDW
ncbi:hypothetical protein U1Q18_006192, partial [Sarracenia purpurea var. burkii]